MNKDVLAGRDDLIVWDFDFAITTFFEIDTDVIQPLIPKQLNLMEAAPGLSIINITAFNFRAGMLEGLPEFQELIFSALVAPDLSRGVPSFAMYVLSLASTCQQHLDHSAEYYHLPIYGLVDKAELSQTDLSASYMNAEGSLFSIRNGMENPPFAAEERYFQAFTSNGDDVFISDMIIETELYEHQKTDNIGQLTTHPFYRGIDMDACEPEPYLQMVAKPGALGKQFYPKPDKFG